MVFNSSDTIRVDEEIPSFLTTTTFPPAFASQFTTGFTQKDLTAIDRIVDSFMGQYKAPGMSIAYTKNGRLVYAKGFGVVRRLTRLERLLSFLPGQGIPEGLEVNPWHLFRIASVSKPITAVAIMMLVEQGRLTLADRVFGKGALLGNDFGFGNLPPGQNTQRLSQITVQHLLEHTSGGWSNNGADPMFIKTEMDQNQLITWVLENRPLDNDPGSVHSYSNFGFCLLGRIIEKVTGQIYSDYVKDNILRRCGITNMHIAGDRLLDRRSDEVRYYPSDVRPFDPYLLPVARMDSHGGWLASAVDLVRFVVHVDGSPTKPDILSAATIQTMTTRTQVKDTDNRYPNYAKDWAVGKIAIGNPLPGTTSSIPFRDANWWHVGNLDGTLSLMVRKGGGSFCWAALVNRWQWDSSMIEDLDNLMWKIVNTVSTWPDHDLFPFYDDPWQFVAIDYGMTVVSKP
jgi:CubicO group peptidase (beta-lactamase class C family)